ncbi:hypothetical protein P170DRAFT_16706 [Aspergillus steynii IBT 23096]|uniref:Uncharacterized protein n=1 Tax=Aspergillus steynii IBT 23096 TaxID=1392250 RepID=A0A2I2GNG7_9EURO|nr:uncharacterized protein P170DRAFT_16706 [Aspergillus steynii IBT 23096]PLB54399.1 hypothetical protein P170DRAFT_16706 [Aspergillus steynii IBT 23096]
MRLCMSMYVGGKKKRKNGKRKKKNGRRESKRKIIRIKKKKKAMDRSSDKQRMDNALTSIGFRVVALCGGDSDISFRGG